MHRSVHRFVESALTRRDIENKHVLEVGAYDVNGSVRPFIEQHHPAEYVGIDARPGPGVDLVVNAEHLTDAMGFASWDLIVSTEMLEHVEDWRACMAEMTSALKLGGLLVLSTRSPGFPFHEFPHDHWRYTRDQMTAILAALKLECIRLDDDPDHPGVFVVARKPRDRHCFYREDLMDLNVSVVS